MSADLHVGATLDYVRAHASSIVCRCQRCGSFDVPLEWLIEHLGADFPLRDLGLCAVACPTCGAAGTRLKISSPKASDRPAGTSSISNVAPQRLP